MKHLILAVLSAALALSSVDTALANSCSTSRTEPAAIAEIVRFRLAPGVEQADFLKSVEATERYLCNAEGFVRRTLLQDESGAWTDYVEWTSKGAAMTAANAATGNEDMQPFMMSIDRSGLEVRHLEVRRLLD